MKTNAFNKIILILFLIFLGVYFAGKNGYYDSLSKKTELTEQQIMKFEEDISNNVEIDLQEYLPKKINYSNFVSRGAYNLSKILQYFLNDQCKDLWSFIKTLFIS